MKSVSKSYLYRHEVTDAAINGLLETIERFVSGKFKPEILDYNQVNVRGRKHKP